MKISAAIMLVIVSMIFGTPAAHAAPHAARPTAAAAKGVCVDKAEFKKIKKGMPISKVKKVVGGKPVHASSDSSTWWACGREAWVYVGTKKHKVTSKGWYECGEPRLQGAARRC